ncbi:type II toxin-antitoxin system VapC family toxin [Saprospiraceae bacterium]|nr:type II toxin-antitoxin system VapC family toxin [Saprospiraceae bacterium]
MKVVIDVSMIIHLLLFDRTTLNRASELISEFEAPHLYKSECANALLQYIKHDKLSSDVSIEYWNMAHDFISQFHSLDIRLIELVISLSIQHRISAYDAQYLAIAKSKQLKLFTRDKKLAKAAESENLLFDMSLI